MSRKSRGKPLVELVCFCLNPNHYHLLLREIIPGGISRFMKRLGGYSYYFNLRHKRSGALFAGQFKAKRIQSNEHLVHLSSYINLNNRVHKLSGPISRLVRSSWGEYTHDVNGLCTKNCILGQFKNKNDYEKFATDNLPHMIAKRVDYEELKNLD
ncbi:MAG: transposase [Patescibacteria group bacterium]